MIYCVYEALICISITVDYSDIDNSSDGNFLCRVEAVNCNVIFTVLSILVLTMIVFLCIADIDWYYCCIVIPERYCW